MYMTAIAYEESLYATLYSDPEHEQREVGQHRRALRRRSTPSAIRRWPRSRRAMTLGDGDERFALGIDVIINGLLATPTEGRLNPVAWEQQP